MKGPCVHAACEREVVVSRVDLKSTPLHQVTFGVIKTDTVRTRGLRYRVGSMSADIADPTASSPFCRVDVLMCPGYNPLFGLLVVLAKRTALKHTRSHAGPPTPAFAWMRPVRAAAARRDLQQLDACNTAFAPTLSMVVRCCSRGVTAQRS